MTMTMGQKQTAVIIDCVRVNDHDDHHNSSSSSNSKQSRKTAVSSDSVRVNDSTTPAAVTTADRAETGSSDRVSQRP